MTRYFKALFQRYSLVFRELKPGGKLKNHPFNFNKVCLYSTSQLGFVQRMENCNKTVFPIFNAAVNSVLPHQLIKTNLVISKDGKSFIINGSEYPLDHNVYVVGFGKAVLGMAKAVDDALVEHIVNGLVSIPTGLQENLQKHGKMDMLLSTDSKIKVAEGAYNNMPDSAAHNAAIKIQDIVSQLTEKDILIVLISGGGSTLLTLPHPPITLEELLELTKAMSKGGASIDELNIVRKNVEVLKGGGLARQAFPAKVISLIISDVIGDKLDIIASGPTVADKSTPQQSLLILKQMGILDTIPKAVKTLLERRTRELNKSTTSEEYSGRSQFSHVQNLIVGSNKYALGAAASKAKEMGYLTIVLSSSLDGEARKIGKLFALLARYVILAFTRKRSDVRSSTNVQLELELVSGSVPKSTLKKVVTLADQAYNTGKPVCILTGGETTVHVTGSGKGGRNQEMVAACAVELDKQCQEDPGILGDYRVTFLSGGTDGIDGPTPAAGAVIDLSFIQKCRDRNMDPLTFLDNNDTYNLFQMVDKDCLLHVGHTGTNVMDIQALVIESR